MSDESCIGANIFAGMLQEKAPTGIRDIHSEHNPGCHATSCRKFCLAISRDRAGAIGRCSNEQCKTLLPLSQSGGRRLPTANKPARGRRDGCLRRMEETEGRRAEGGRRCVGGE